MPTRKLLAMAMLGLTLSLAAQENWDFELGSLAGWTPTGAAFAHQPTFGDNVGCSACRRPGVAINYQGNYWIGTYERRPSSLIPLGTIQGDGPTGTLVSPEFTISSERRYINFLIGGGLDFGRLRVELLVRQRPGDPEPPDLWLFGIGTPVWLGDVEYFVGVSATGRNSEVMRRQIWDCLPYLGRSARIRIVDNSSRPWGHINCDDFRFSSDPVGDIWITGMEVTQAIQNYPGNTIPLIGRKKTLVRVYAQSRPDARGPWNDVTARLTLRRGTYSRVLIPIGINNGSLAQPVPPGGSDRNDLNTSFNFLLNPEETFQGDAQLEARIYSISDRAESDRNNNRSNQTVHFNSPLGFRVYGWSYANTNNPPASPTCMNRAPNHFRPPFTDFEVHREWAENVFPVAILSLGPISEPEYPFREYPFREYPFREENNSDCEAYIRAHNWLAGQFARLFPRGGERGYLFTPESGPGYNGWCCNRDSGNRIARGENQRVDPTVFAHEIAHSWDRWHTQNVPAVQGERDFSFPRTDGTMGSQTGVRISPRGVEVVPPTYPDGTGRGDLMSYTHPVFISPYTYCGLMNAISRGTLGCPPGTAGSAGAGGAQDIVHSSPAGILASASASDAGAPGDGGSPLFLYIAGLIHPDGSATFEPFELIPSLEDIASQSQGAQYRLALEDALGNALVEHLFDPNLGYEVDAGNPIRFSAFIPWHTMTVRVVLHNKEGLLLAERLITPSTPTVSLLAPSGGETWSGSHTVKWEAEDLDSDRLWFTVYYSSDGGQRWIPVDHSLSNTLLEVNYDNLPGSDQALMRIAASDGINTAWSQTASFFTVPRKAPQVTINAPDPIDPLAPPVLLTASAFDWEDGPIEDPVAYTWSSDRDGALGQGLWVTLNHLSPGMHVISLSVFDTDQNLSTASVTISVPEKPLLAPEVTPFLGIRILNEQQAELAWPATAWQYVLQASDAVGLGAKWQTVEQSPKDEGYQLSLVVNRADGGRFYRLALP